MVFFQISAVPMDMGGREETQISRNRGLGFVAVQQFGRDYIRGVG